MHACTYIYIYIYIYTEGKGYQDQPHTDTSAELYLTAGLTRADNPSTPISLVWTLISSSDSFSSIISLFMVLSVTGIFTFTPLHKARWQCGKLAGALDPKGAPRAPKVVKLKFVCPIEVQLTWMDPWNCFNLYCSLCEVIFFFKLIFFFFCQVSYTHKTLTKVVLFNPDYCKAVHNEYLHYHHDLLTPIMTVSAFFQPLRSQPALWNH